MTIRSNPLRFSGAIPGVLAESLWPQISVSKVAVCHLSTGPTSNGNSTTLDPVRDGWISPSWQSLRALLSFFGVPLLQRH